MHYKTFFSFTYDFRINIYLYIIFFDYVINNPIQIKVTPE